MGLRNEMAKLHLPVTITHLHVFYDQEIAKLGFIFFLKTLLKGSLSSLLDFADFVSFSAKTTQDKY